LLVWVEPKLTLTGLRRWSGSWSIDALVASVNRKGVTDVKEFEKAVRQSADGKVLLRIRTPEGARFVLLSLNE
jgi:hypothetical protein